MSQLSRREFLRLSALAAAGMAVVACAKTQAPTAVVETKATQAPATPKPEEKAAAPEAPMLTELVSAGKLPALEERLPQEVMVIDAGTLIPADMVEWEVGKFGGTMRLCTARTDVCAEMYDANAEPMMIAPGKLTAASPEEIKPNLFKGFEVSDDQKTITWYMRKGLKWSDGEPCTSDDVKFWYEDVLLNTEITPTPGSGYKSRSQPAGELMKLEVVDDYTFKCIFAEPGLHMLRNFSGYSANWNSIMRPAHYMKQFHKNYANAEELKKLLDEAKLPESEWFRYYGQREEGNLGWTNVKSLDPLYPHLSPWFVENLSASMATWTRNPYYYKVDTAGQQLPYIDKERAEIVTNTEAVTMKILAGEVDWGREYASMVNYPLYKENEAKGGFQVNITQMHVAPLQIAFNFTNPDDNYRTVIRDVRFRKAMNMAIDHQKVVDTIYQGFGTPPTEITGCPYDPEGAMKLLDEMGMDKKDADGNRLGPDGKTFVFPLEVQKGYTPEQTPLCELLVEYWADIGIKTDFKEVEATLYGTRNTNNDLFVGVGWAHTSFWRTAPTGSDYTPGWTRLWSLWYSTQGKEGEEPEPWARRLWEITDQANSFLLDANGVKQISDEMFAILKEQVPFIMPIDNAVYPLLGSTKLGNVPNKGWAIVASFTQEEFFFKS